MNGDAAILRWSGRVLAEEDLRRNLKGQRRLIVSAATVVTPSATEELQRRAVEVVREKQEISDTKWGYAVDRAYPAVAAALQALGREGIGAQPLTSSKEVEPSLWSKELAESLSRGDFKALAVFTQDPGLFCCIANKVRAVRAVGIATIGQAARAKSSLGANLLAIEMPGRTFYEILQILRSLYGANGRPCPPLTARTLTELDGHAHR